MSEQGTQTARRATPQQAQPATTAEQPPEPRQQPRPDQGVLAEQQQQQRAESGKADPLAIEPSNFLGDVKNVTHIYGPLSGQIITMPTADADAAVAEGWARHAYERPPMDMDVVHTPEEAWDMRQKAEAAVRKLRGEPEPPPEAEPKPGEEEGALGRKNKTRASTAEADQGGNYKTRDMAAGEKK